VGLMEKDQTHCMSLPPHAHSPTRYCTGRKLFRHLPTYKILSAKTEVAIPTEAQVPIDCFLTTEVWQTLPSGVHLGNYKILLHGKRLLAIFQPLGLYVCLGKELHVS